MAVAPGSVICLALGCYRPHWPPIDSLILPIYAAGTSLAVFLSQVVLQNVARWIWSKKYAARRSLHDATRQDESSSRSATRGGWDVVVWQYARLFCCTALFALCLHSATRAGARKPAYGGLGGWMEMNLCAIYLYMSLLGVLSILSSRWASRAARQHLMVLLLVTWSCYAYRDLWPLATFTLSPMDAAEGNILWAKVSILTFATLVIPLCAPRRYIPVDPKDPTSEPSAEQTASLVSLVTYTWLDQIILKASQMSHLPSDQFLPLADYDRARYLTERALPHVDPLVVTRKRHIFWGIIRVFVVDFFVMATTLTIRAVTTFASPIGVYQLLQYLEADGSDATVRPWVWISFLFLGPVLGSIAIQWYIFTSTRMTVRSEAIITQLVFNHALRIRTTDTAENETGSGIGDEHMEAIETVGQEDNKDRRSVGTPIIGKLNNLVTSDLRNIYHGCDILYIILYLPVQSGLCIWFLYTVLDWSAFVGMAVMILLLPVPGISAGFIQKVQAEKMRKTDSRVQHVSDFLKLIRMIKLFGWEPLIGERLADMRESELEYVKEYKLLEVLNNCVNYLIPVAIMVATFVTYTIIMHRSLTASRVFSSMAAFSLLRENLNNVLGMSPALVQAKVSLDRLNEFLNETELLDKFSEKDASDSEQSTSVFPEEIGFRNALFTWTKATPGSFILRIDTELFFKRNGINVIIGPTGSGKTSMLLALLGELRYHALSPDSFYNLPRSNGVAYVPQESWIQNATIRENILFGSVYDKRRYEQVLEQCALKRDIELLGAGDQAEVGEMGVTLSGGQKARIGLARALYSTAELLLIDDVFAALDVSTTQWIVNSCFQSDLVRGRTVILATHNISAASFIADFVVTLDASGRVLKQQNLSKSPASGDILEIGTIGVDVYSEGSMAEHDVHQSIGLEGIGTLIEEEEISEGHVGWLPLKMYLSRMAGKRPLLFWSFCAAALAGCELLQVSRVWWLGNWAEQYASHPASDVAVSYYLSVFSTMLFLGSACYSATFIAFAYGSLRASRSIHKSLLGSIFGTTLRWLDKTPTSRIVARCTQDIQEVDGALSSNFEWLAGLTGSMLFEFGAVIIFSPAFLLPGGAVTVLGVWCGQLYMKAQLSAKREMSNARAPVLGHFDATIRGLTSIRAYGAEHAFTQESYRRIDRYTRITRSFYNLSRWVTLRMEALGGVFAAALAIFLVYGGRTSASDTGFSLNMAVAFSGTILWWIMAVNQFELSGNSLERIQQYLDTEKEPKRSDAGVPPAYWPASGDLKVNGLCARYSQDGPRVLHDISFEVRSGQRVGIVGRTGSGKSSLALALLRCILTEGEVYYDGIRTDSINLDALRSNLAIIPQDPELLRGSLRYNLDPFQGHDDAILNGALRASGLTTLQVGSEMSLTLDSAIAAGGSNLSVGQRQMVALARAIVRQSKLLILDEATSAIDYETDATIQKSLRQELKSDVTVLTVAHRLRTIMDADQILVLDAGRMIEYGPPNQLLSNEKSKFRALVEESSDKAELYAMVSGESSV
ncbi:P-loop containing nucleoside triphosphate hydrolase protein [Obba rivulosa]|uniref:P-loop containing nucleoside triphosphate hydrolase protein n=1 Tax=Obba rivulosa TaxID=1052685 RepID=A0A8E2ASQ7_9APHY|nr:P-loop containing nucleoside triphosphate hydrolase protein [Obba rivulosa]